MGDLGFPAQRRPRHRGRFPGANRRSARGRPQHHDVDEGRRQTDLVHRGRRRASGGSGGLYRAAQRRLRAPRRARDLVRPRLGRLPACAPGPQHEGSGGRHADALHRRGMFRSRPPVQGLAQRRARRRHRPERVQRADVRRAHRPRLRGGEGRVRSERPAQSRPDRARAALRRPVAVPLRAGLSRHRGVFA